MYNIELPGVVQTNISSEYLKERQFFDGRGLIVDMHGIKNFINGKLLEFKDSDVRNMLQRLSLLSDEKYLRIGVSGADIFKTHPGGEVLEDMIINGLDGSGISNSYSGYLVDTNGFSEGVKLSLNSRMIENRIVYSHTAFIGTNSVDSCPSFKLTITQLDTDLLQHIKYISELLNISAYSVQMSVKSLNEGNVKVVGRVLKRKPDFKFNSINDASEIGNEKTFYLNREQTIITFGTYYNRNEVEWTELTDGRIYERFGHYHARLINNVTSNQHEVFHLRKIFVQSNSNAEVEVILKPIKEIAKITPVSYHNQSLVCAITNKSIKQLYDEFNE